MYRISFLSVCILCVLPLPLHADETATVLRVIDGDTIVARIGSVVEHVRLIGIDAPEMKDRSTRVAQCYAREAKKELRRLVGRSPVMLSRDQYTKNRDAYGRLLRMLKVQGVSRESINFLMVHNGFAAATPRFAFEQRGLFIQSQKSAQIRRVGLWSACSTRQGKYLSGSTGRPLERTSK